MDRLAVYIHWPFCVSKCPYCDFNSHVREKIDQQQWLEAYLREIDTTAQRLPGRRVTSIFFGGGTPSLMPPQTVAAIIDCVTQRWHIANDCEITLEANPSSVEQARFEGFRAAGVNRVSLGVQALHDDVLKFLGRPHSADEAKAAIALAARIFPRYSFDLIYARPKQTAQQWEAELASALELAGDHLSLYQLTIEPGTPFHTMHKRGEIVIPDADEAASLYEQTAAQMAAAGRPSYEISNYAAPGQESQHNLAYWRYQDYAGIGPGAHGRITQDGQKRATRMHRAPEIWLGRVAETGQGLAEDEVIAPNQQFEEAVMMGLRLTEGLPADKTSQLQPERIAALAAEGLVKLDAQGVLSTTARGALVLNEVTRFLLA